VISQTFQNWELLIIDDASTDSTPEVIKQFVLSDSRVKYIRINKNIGMPALTSANAFSLMTGDWLAWQFDDCEWEPNHLQSLTNSAKMNRKSFIFYGRARVNVGSNSIVFGEAFDKQKLMTSNFIPNCTTLIKREVISKIGWVDPHILLKRTNDHDFWIRASEEFNFTFIEDILATEHGPSLDDSLGNSVSLFPELSKKYMEMPRDYLNIEEIKLIDNFRSFSWMSEREKTQLALLTLEHLSRIGDIDSVQEKLISIFESNSKTDSDFLGTSTFSMSKILIAIAEFRLSEIVEKNDLIDEQQRYIDEQQRYIDEQQRYIDVPKSIDL
jgi:glycosyltransferase involved in cell wall biosynthesis